MYATLSFVCDVRYIKKCQNVIMAIKCKHLYLRTELDVNHVHEANGLLKSKKRAVRIKQVQVLFPFEKETQITICSTEYPLYCAHYHSRCHTKLASTNNLESLPSAVRPNFIALNCLKVLTCNF